MTRGPLRLFKVETLTETEEGGGGAGSLARIEMDSDKLHLTTGRF